MVSETREVDSQTRTNGHSQATPRLQRNLFGITHDLLALSELQLRMFAIDARALLKRAAIPGGILIFAILVIFAGAAVSLAGLSLLIAEWTGLSPGWAYSIVGMVALLLGAGAAVLSWRVLYRATATFNRSLHALSKNLEAVKAALMRRGSEY